MIDFNKVVCTSLMLRSVYLDFGPMDSTLEMFEDWDFFMKVLQAKRIFARADTYLKYRQRIQSRNKKYKDEERKTCFTKIRSRYE
jgi:hypothetical protein